MPDEILNLLPNGQYLNFLLWIYFIGQEDSYFSYDAIYIVIIRSKLMKQFMNAFFDYVFESLISS